MAIRPALVGVSGLAALLGVLNLAQWHSYRSADEPSPEATIEAFHKLFYDSRSTWDQNTWLGVTTKQNPNDVWITQEILFEVKPDFVIETGALHGGSAALWAMVLEEVNPEARVITIDIADQIDARDLSIFQRKVDFLRGSSTAPKIVRELARRVEGKKVLVILDSDHSKAHVAKELELYAPLVSVGSYLIVQDSNVNGHPVRLDHGAGPWEALEEFLARDDRFEVDRSRERLLFTMHPGGYLRRVR